jgi:ketosteroid isomerase-like protein
MTVATEHPNATLFRRGYDAFNSADLDTVRSLFANDIVWHASGRDRFAGDKHGIDATMGSFLEIMQATSGSFHLDIHDIIANDDHAVALVTSHLEVDGKKYEDRGAHVVHIKDGKVTESWFFAWNPYQLEALFPA